MKLFTSVVLLFAVIATANCKADKLDIAVYTTSRCGDTIRFINNQLTPVYKDFKDYLNIEFIPWGKSRRNPDGSVTCQFGATDCAANKLQSCALYYLDKDQDAQIDYMDCEFRTLSSVSQDYTCVKNAGLTENVVKTCVEGSLGNQLESNNEKRTSEITMVFVPTIVLDNQYSAANQIAAFSNFRAFVCKELGNVPPC